MPIRKRKEGYPLRIRKTGRYELWIRCPMTGKVQKYSCGKNRCKYFLRKFGDICYCSHPDAQKYVEVGT